MDRNRVHALTLSLLLSIIIVRYQVSLNSLDTGFYWKWLRFGICTIGKIDERTKERNREIDQPLQCNKISVLQLCSASVGIIKHLPVNNEQAGNKSDKQTLPAFYMGEEELMASDLFALHRYLHDSCQMNINENWFKRLNCVNYWAPNIEHKMDDLCAPKHWITLSNIQWLTRSFSAQKTFQAIFRKVICFHHSEWS